MPGLGDNILSLSRMRQRREQAMANLAEPLRLKLTAPSRSNPGELRMLTYVPPGLPPGAPLVVVLHGCTQNAASYDHGSGWSTLAERHGFALLFPEQQRSNNASLCFNWYQPGDTSQGQGEVESIRQMVLQMVAAHRLDARRVYVTGLSAGGAMTAAMLATSPDLFAGGAIIAGLPFGSASGTMEALSAMKQAPRLGGPAWGALVRSAAGARGPFPPVQVWHGTADQTVEPGNGDALVLQWADVLGVRAQPDAVETVDGATHRVWRRGGLAVLEQWSVPGLAHGTPIMADGLDVDRTVGVAGPHMLAGRIASTWHLARSWGLLTQAARTRDATGAERRPSPGDVSSDGPSAGARGPGPLAAAGSMIEKAMRAAGLMRTSS